MNSLQKRLNKVQLNIGQNVTLDEAEKTREFKRFQVNVKKSIQIQANQVSKDQDLVDQLISLTVKVDFNQLMVGLIVKAITPLGDVFDGLTKEGAFFSFFMFAGNVGGQSALDKLNIDDKFDLENDEVIRFLRDRKNLLIQSVDDTTAKRISKLIEEGRAGLLTNFEVSQLISEEFREISIFRAEMIAHTELANAVNAVELMTMQRNGVREVRWVTSIDERVCPICRPLHNDVVGVTQDFNSIGDGGFVGPRPPAHVNCRCFLEVVQTGFEPTLQTFAQAQADPTSGRQIAWTGS